MAGKATTLSSTMTSGASSSKISVSRGSTYFEPSMRACQVGAMNSPSCSRVGLAEDRGRVADEVDPELAGDLRLGRWRTEPHQPLLEALGLEGPGERLLDDEDDAVAPLAQHVPDPDAVVRRAEGTLGEEDDRARVGHVSLASVPPNLASQDQRDEHRREGRRQHDGVAWCPALDPEVGPVARTEARASMDIATRSPWRMASTSRPTNSRGCHTAQAPDAPRLAQRREVLDKRGSAW